MSVKGTEVDIRLAAVVTLDWKSGSKTYDTRQFAQNKEEGKTINKSFEGF